KLRGMTDLDYVNNGYQVRLTYQVTAPDWTYELVLILHGTTAPGKGSQDRQWQIIMQGLPPRNLMPTSHGKAMRAAQEQAQAFAGGWVNLLRSGEGERAYLATLPTSKREEISQAHRGALAVL